MKRRLLATLLLLAFCLTVPAQRNRSSRQARPTKKEQLQRQRQQLRQQQEQARKRQQEVEKKLKERMKDVEALGYDISVRQMVIDSLNLEIDSVNANIAVLDSQLCVLQQELEERRQHYIQSLRYMYRNRNSQRQLIFVLSAGNFNQMYRRLRFMNEYTTHQRAQGEAVKQKSEQVSAKLTELNVARGELSTLLAKNEAEQLQLEAQKTEQQHIVDELEHEKQTVHKLIVQQQQQEAELTRQIDKLIAEEIERARRAEEERQRRLAEQRRRDAANNANGNVNTNANHNGNGNGNGNANSGRRRNNNTSSSMNAADPDRALTGSFTSNKGKLPVPITGKYRIIRNYGSYSLGGVTLWSSGIQLEGETGAQARCVFDGEVSGIYNAANSYVVMVRHGRYISVYSNLASVSVASGQRVTINQILGNVAASHVLLFRLHNWNEPLDPKKWIKRR